MKGPAIGVPDVPNCRQRMNTGIITSELPETEELVEESREAGLGGESDGRRWYLTRREQALLIMVCPSFFRPELPARDSDYGTHEKRS